MTELNQKKKLNGNQQRSKSYNIDYQNTNKGIEHKRIHKADENLMLSRIYYGPKTHFIVGILRCFKLGGFEGLNINTISQLVLLLHGTGMILKHTKGEHTPLKISSLNTEVEKIWSVIQKEDTKSIDPYGYDVIIIH